MAANTASSNLDVAIDRAVTATMSIQGGLHAEARRDLIRGLEALANAERALGVDLDPVERFTYVARIADSDDERSDVAVEVIDAMRR